MILLFLFVNAIFMQNSIERKSTATEDRVTANLSPSIRFTKLLN